MGSRWRQEKRLGLFPTESWVRPEIPRNKSLGGPEQALGDGSELAAVIIIISLILIILCIAGMKTGASCMPDKCFCPGP